MSIHNLVVLSHLNPPAQRSHVLQRPRISELLASSLDYPITLLRAGTGYGKSTALISFIEEQSISAFWYTVAPNDRDPVLFLAKLFSAFNQNGYNLGREALRILELAEAAFQDAMISFVNTLAEKLHQDSLLVLDDFQQVREVPEILRLVDWLVDHLPKHLHLLISSRRSLDLPSLNKWRVKGTLLEIRSDAMAFTQSEIETLFESQYHVHLQPHESKLLFEKTEGWAIGLQMVWQSLRSSPGQGIQRILEDDRESRKALFAYLAEEVLGHRAEHIQTFLLHTSILSTLDSETCDFLMSITNSNQILADLHQSGLFIEELRPGVYRYHQMFREFLQNRLSREPEKMLELHRKTASYFSAHQNWEHALSHHLSAGDYRQVDQILQDVGQKLIKDGLEESVTYWISNFPEHELRKYPYLNYLLGEVNRYASRFSTALENYHAAQRLYEAAGNRWGISLALRGQAQVYLDTIRPLNADQPLKDALALLDPLEAREDYANLLTLIAENQLNLGYPESAEEYLKQARAFHRDEPVDNYFIQARILLRSGRIDEGIALLEGLEPDQDIQSVSRPQRFHREASVLLSLFHAFKGDLEQSVHYAERGIEIARQLRSNYVYSVSTMRLGHPLQLGVYADWSGNDFERAIANYQDAIKRVDVTRIHVEPMWGLCRAYGFSGQIAEANRVASEALAIAKNAGDEWISMLIRISLGAGEVLAGNYEAANLSLTIAESTAQRVGDPFGLCAARLWLAMNASRQGYRNSMLIYLEKLLSAVAEHHYEFLLTKPTWLGSNEPLEFVPLLIQAQQNGIQEALVDQLLMTLDAAGLCYHPGYGLRIQTFGSFAVWCGRYEVSPTAWKREKARQMLQLLAANFGKWLSRDQITLILWPDADQTTAANNFKVTLSALNQVMEPERPSGAAAYFIQRRGDQYILNPAARLRIDNKVFELLCKSDDTGKWEQAVALYQGNYFQNELIQEWLTAEVQYYQQLYIQTMQKLIDQALQDNELERAMTYTHSMLGRDALWEPAYRTLMSLYHRQGNQGMVQQVYQQCQQVFTRQLGTDISPETHALYDELMDRG